MRALLPLLLLLLVAAWGGCQTALDDESRRGNVEEGPTYEDEVTGEPMPGAFEVSDEDPAEACDCGWACSDEGCGCVPCPSDTDGTCGSCGMDCNGYDCWCLTCDQ